MKRLSILFLIFLIIVLSGCMDFGETLIISTKDGVVITDFSFEYSPVYAGDYVGLRLEVQNVGGSEATLTKIQAYGVDFTSGNSSTEREWRIVKGDEELDKNDIETYLPSGGVLGQPNPDVNIEGDIDYYEWRLQAPLIAAETDYDFRVRVEYDYETTYSAIIRVVNDEYLQTLNEEDRQKLFNAGGIVSSELTGGPISVTPFASRHFIVIPGGGESGERKIKFKIENVGKGYTYVGDKNYYVELVDVKPTGLITGCDTQLINGKKMIKLSGGKSHIIECDFTLPTNVANKIDKSFQIAFEYKYYIDGSTSITVKPAY